MISLINYQTTNDVFATCVRAFWMCLYRVRRKINVVQQKYERPSSTWTPRTRWQSELRVGSITERSKSDRPGLGQACTDAPAGLAQRIDGRALLTVVAGLVARRWPGGQVAQAHGAVERLIAQSQRGHGAAAAAGRGSRRVECERPPTKRVRETLPCQRGFFPTVF